MARQQPQQPPQQPPQQQPISLDGTAANATWLRHLERDRHAPPFPPPLPRLSQRPHPKRPKPAR